MYYTIYETTNLINKKKYIGMHFTKNINDSYLGSGIAIKNSIKKYGRQNFKKKILFIFNNEQDMRNKEEELITKDIINNPRYYNMKLGGKGARKGENRWFGNKNPFYGKTHNEKSKQLMSKWHLDHGEEIGKHLSIVNKGRVFWCDKWKIIKPTGEIEIIENLQKYCRDNNLQQGNMMNIALGKRKSHKGYKVEKI